jgi:hypothetical protein
MQAPVQNEFVFVANALEVKIALYPQHMAEPRFSL